MKKKSKKASKREHARRNEQSRAQWEKDNPGMYEAMSRFVHEDVYRHVGNIGFGY